MPAALVAVAVVVHAGLPVTPEVARVWPSTKPVIVAVSVGTAPPNCIVWLLAVTVESGRRDRARSRTA